MSEQARQNLTQSHQCDKITSQSTSMTFGGSAERTETQSIDKVSLKKATSHDYTQIVTLVSNGETSSAHDDEFPWSFDAVSELMNIRPWSSSFLAYMLSKARKAIAKGKITISTSKCHVCFTIMDDCYETHKFEEYHQMILCRWSMQSYSKHASLESPYLKNL
ncbi:hypothetical protein CRE_21590 [Caenorhabditis remanei]|uniref:Uncharacterized protein n=1 Tax=Caenorhabditis remanei TaxID=31234 RepID=E3NJV0_CAERE|nr:hypothetical protein CRE_21590 [Caenorhabditis remanei]